MIVELCLRSSLELWVFCFLSNGERRATKSFPTTWQWSIVKLWRLWRSSSAITRDSEAGVTMASIVLSPWMLLGFEQNEDGVNAEVKIWLSWINVNKWEFIRIIQNLSSVIPLEENTLSLNALNAWSSCRRPKCIPGWNNPETIQKCRTIKPQNIAKCCKTQSHLARLQPLLKVKQQKS